MRSLKKQSGAAAIYFVFIAIAILSMGALGVEGSRYITEKAHLGDVMEATAIAVSESDEIRDEAGFDQKRATKTATAWVNYLVPDNKGADFTVSREKHTYKKEVKPKVFVERTVHHYKIDSTTTQDSWMYMKGLPSFDKQQKVYNKATAARVRTDFEPVDVVFVSDFSGSMKNYNRIGNLKKAIKSVTTTIFDATQELKQKHPNETINDSSFGFVPFSKRIVVRKGDKFFCSSLLLGKKLSIFDRPRGNNTFDSLVSSSDRERWYKDNRFTSEERRVSEKYVTWARSRSYYRVLGLDCNHGSGCRSGWNDEFRDHIDYRRTAKEIQLSDELKLMTPLKLGSSVTKTANESFCSTRSSTPAHYMLERVEMNSSTQLSKFNNDINKMRIGGGTDMYQGLLAAPQQLYRGKNKNRFIFVLSDGEENNNSFKKLVNNGLCENIRNELSTNEKGEAVKFEMFVIGLKFNNKAQAYKDCFGKHIYEVKDLSKLKDVIMELLSTTTSYNVER
ncbi:pilus assembly protein [Vibrio tapetis]|uniref:VWFA domain-containing protein n=1 Tax=Vibrio tapetis subsp. tapetis TaxID=1671868 RepID=A0A2N8ZIZ7_9VIBR|nr:VWA domain-containing protein [Vibrio tapetis]SON51895.1 exported protein of unknown function [Vibrio tapetis subsp. tapetis]